MIDFMATNEKLLEDWFISLHHSFREFKQSLNFLCIIEGSYIGAFV
jgi:hypothetical protein